MNIEEVKPPFEPIKLPDDSGLTPEQIAAKAEADRIAQEAADKAAADKAAADAKAAEEAKKYEGLTPEEIAALKAKETQTTDNTIIFEIDGKEVVYKLNETGDAVDADGNVFKTKNEIAALSKPDDDTVDVSIDAIEKISGINIFDDKGEKLTFEPTVEGLAKREIAIATQYQTEGYNQALEELFTIHPEVQQLINHKQLYGNLDDFGKAIKIDTITVDKENKAQHKQLIVEAEIARGRSIESANKLADMYVADSSSFKEAEEAVKFLKTKRDGENAAKERELEIQRTNAVKQTEEYYGVHYDAKQNKIIPLDIEDSIFNKIVKKGEIGALKIPETGLTIIENGKPIKLSRSDIFNYIAVVDPELGMTKAKAKEFEYMNDKDNYILHNLRILLGKSFNEIIGVNKTTNVPPRRIKLPSSNNQQQTGNLKVKLPFGT